LGGLCFFFNQAGDIREVALKQTEKVDLIKGYLLAVPREE
jgi:hypothetical protein